MKPNWKYAFLSLVLLLIELIIALFLHDTIIRPYIGDILVIVLLYCIIKTFVRKTIVLLPLYLFIFASFVEILQLLHIISLLHLENIAVLRVIVGSTFDWADILCYFLGALAAVSIQRLDSKHGKLLIPAFISAAAVSALTFFILAYNGLWWPVNPKLMGYEIMGIDVARYQGNIDWQVISKQGIKFAYIKASEGSTYKDPLFKNNVIESKENGIANGAYHYFSADSPGEAQALNFLSAASQYKTDMPYVLDFEVGPGGERGKVISELKAFLQEIQDSIGIKPIIYTTYKSYNSYLSNDFTDYSFWFRDLLRVPSFEGNLIFWQYCNRGRLVGIDKSQEFVDLNVFMGNEQEFQEFLHRGS